MSVSLYRGSLLSQRDKYLFPFSLDLQLLSFVPLGPNKSMCWEHGLGVSWANFAVPLKHHWPSIPIEFQPGLHKLWSRVPESVVKSSSPSLSKVLELDVSDCPAQVVSPVPSALPGDKRPSLCWKPLSHRMSLQWTAVATFLYAEVFAVLLLCIPFISPKRYG